MAATTVHSSTLVLARLRRWKAGAMRYAKLGNTGLDVSRVVLGCMSWGEADRGWHPWILDEDAARVIIRQALEAGITTFDTANVYAGGSSEEFTGRALRDFAKREDVVIATKVHGRMRPGPYGAGLSRKAILHEIDESLRRLGTDYVDLYQIHRWDPEVPIEETMEALHDVVRAGKARYLGASSMWAWQFAKAQHVAAANGWTPFVSMQNHYNLIYREEEREMLPLCADQGVGVIPWSPLARGRITRDWDAETARSETDEWGADLYRRRGPLDRGDGGDGRGRGSASPAPRSASPGCCTSPPSPPRSSASPSRRTSPTPSPPSTWSCRRRPGRARRRLPPAPGLGARLDRLRRTPQPDVETLLDPVTLPMGPLVTRDSNGHT